MSCEEHGGELDLEKGVFLRRREADSGNNSLQSSTGTASSKLSQPRECNSFLEEEEADYEEERPSPEVRIKTPSANTNIIEVRYRGELPDMSIIYFILHHILLQNGTQWKELKGKQMETRREGGVAM